MPATSTRLADDLVDGDAAVAQVDREGTRSAAWTLTSTTPTPATSVPATIVGS